MVYQHEDLIYGVTIHKIKMAGNRMWNELLHLC